MSGLNGAALAYLGDAVFELEIRKLMVEAGIHRPQNLHAYVAELTSGKAQAWAFDLIESMLNEHEIGFFKHGRNAKLSKKSRRTSMQEAHTSSGFEAIFGGLYMQEDAARIAQLCRHIVQTKYPEFFAK